MFRISLPTLIAYSCLLPPALAAEKPNFVLIFADDLGYGDVGYQGGDVPTPQIDSIARGGVAFSDGYVTCAVCAPSRAGMLTGRYQQSFGFWDNIGPFRRSPDVEPGIPVDVPILSERLKGLGYVCGLFGKTHDGEAEKMMAFSRWDEFYGFNNGASNYLGDMNRSHNPIFHNRRIVSRFYTDRGIKHDQVNDHGVLIRDTENYLTDLLGDHAVGFIESNKDRPFLCYIPFNAIHGPFQAPKELVDKYSDEPDEDRRRVMAILDSMDQNVGRVLETLRKNGLEENTLIVFLSDNGGHDHSPNRPLRGKKGTFWEGGLRVPFCMQWKGKIPAGQMYNQPVISLDLLPTFLAAAGGQIDPDWELDGVDLLPFVTGERTGQPHDYLHWGWGPRKAIRRGGMKAISTNDGESWQLFDLSQDVVEQNDLAASRPKVLETLIQEHRTWEEGLMPPQWGWNSSLGYRDPDFGQPKPYHNPDYFSRSRTSEDERPNVVLIYADDMGWGDVGYHGVDDILTPNIDKLAAQGVQFSQGYVSASVCGPSRAGLMTGVYQQRMGCGENPNTNGFPDNPKFPFAGVPKSQPMLSEMLQQAGYRCGMVGKWHLGLHETMRPNSRGFDDYYGFLNGAHDYEKAFPRFGKNKGLWPLFRNNEMQPEYEGYLTDTFSDEAVGFINRNKNEPFFLYVAYNAVHHPWQVPEKYLERTKGLSEIEDRRFFAGMVLAMDDGVGRIMEALDTAGVSKNTLVLFISDNGSPRGQGLDHPPKDTQKERGGCTMSSAGPFRGFKGDTFEGGIRIPFVMRCPGRIKSGSHYEHPVINLDVAPTILAQLGIEQPPEGFPFDGVDLMPYLNGDKGDERPHDVLYWRRDDDYAIRKGDWKLAWNDASCPPNSNAMLFNLADDPGEHYDLSGEHPDMKKQLQDEFDAWDCRLPPSQCWGGPKNRKPNPDGAAELAKRASEDHLQMLSAADAVLHGDVFRKGPEVISHWREASEWIEWTFTARDSGRHRVILEYAAPHPSNIVVEVAEQQLTSILPTRQNWGDTGEWLVGEVDLAAGREYRLSVKAGQPWRAVNVRRVLLEPLPSTGLTRPDDRPNIVLIMADDLGAECIGAYGCRAYKTPVLDGLAIEGIRFANCHSQPLCTPSRIKIMTGRYAFRNYIGFGKFDMQEITFGKVLQDAGYRTCMAGKWQLGGDYTRPTAMGFDEYCLQNAIEPVEPFDRSSRGRERYWGYPPIVANGRLYESEQQYGPDMISEYAVNFIQRQKDSARPFFLYYPLILPHAPFVPTPLSADGDKSGAKVSELKYFKDMAEYVDVLVGRVVQTLEETGQRENTVVMFTGDNGTTYPVKVTAPAPEGYPRVLGINGARHTSQLPPGVEPTLREGLWEGPLTRADYGDVPGGKDLMSERGTHVPLIVSWPCHGVAHRSFGNSCDDLIDFSDFFATVADLAEAEMPDDRVIDGISFAPRLKGEGASSRETIFCHYWGFGRKKEETRESVRDARWKLYDDGSFYDLMADIEESTPLENLDAEAAQARKRLQTAFEEVRSTQ